MLGVRGLRVGRGNVCYKRPRPSSRPFDSFYPQDLEVYAGGACCKSSIRKKNTLSQL